MGGEGKHPVATLLFFYPKRQMKETLTHIIIIIHAAIFHYSCGNFSFPGSPRFHFLPWLYYHHTIDQDGGGAAAVMVHHQQNK